MAGESWDWFIGNVLIENYDKRRQMRSLNESSKLFIDVLLNQCHYPPESSAKWIECYKKCGKDKRILILYLARDLDNYLESSTRPASVTRSSKQDKTTNQHLAELKNSQITLSNIPKAFDFPNSVVHLATGLWALDNDLTNKATASLSNPSISLYDHFSSPLPVRNLIMDGFIAHDESRTALYMQRIHRYDDWDENYDAIHLKLLVKSGQLVEALKYQRAFSDREDYREILQNFMELCLELNLIRPLNYLNLTAEEEEVLNYYREVESVSSRPVTPCSKQQTTPYRTTVTSNRSEQMDKSRSCRQSRKTPRHRAVQKQHSFSDSPARNTRSARKVAPSQ